MSFQSIHAESRVRQLLQNRCLLRFTNKAYTACKFVFDSFTNLISGASLILVILPKEPGNVSSDS
ncbi:MAG: hypothetical protein CMJ72_13170 [Planctomycetaceae bacterium]|nr:hypothetical protein [Planctomycetaceae bacterium]